jgi:hypothetical protein
LPWKGIAQQIEGLNESELSARWREKLNPDMQMPSPVVVSNTEKIHQLSGFYQTNWGKWQIKVGGQLEQSKVDLGDSSTNKLVYTQFKYAIN